MDDLRPTSEAPQEPARGGILRLLLPSHKHSAGSAAILLGTSSILSGLMGLVRTKYIAYVFGASPQTDAYQAAFELPDMISYFLVGGVASITLVSMLARFRKENDTEGENLALSVVLNAMLTVLAFGVLLGEFLAPIYTRYKFPHFSVEQAILCTNLTRIVLPGQLCFFAGGVLAARLMVRRIFLYQAITPLIYNLGIILGGVFLVHRLGIYSLAWGVLAGVFVGSVLLNGFGAFRTGFHYTPILNLRHPLFREWLRLSLPLMIGVSLVTADKWILSYFASADIGGITRLNMAKTLFLAPISVLGQAAGAASLPFFAAIYSQGRFADFSASVNKAVTRVAAVSLIFASWFVALSIPLVALLFRGGSFHQQDSLQTAHYFSVFALSIALWSAQSIYARGFYAAGNTLTPAIAGTAITLISIPVYGVIFHLFGMPGLPWASNLGITAHVVVLAILLHKKRLVSLAQLQWAELGRALIASLCGWAAIQGILASGVLTSPGRLLLLLRIFVASVAWIAVVYGALRLTGSRLPDQILKRAK
jgi:putative peptidoglycan lipid II flippase